MANKRQLKQSIHQICGRLYAQGVTAAFLSGQPQRQDVDNVLSTIMRMHAYYISRVSHPEPGITAKEYYNNLTDDFMKQVAGILDLINDLA